MPITTRHVFEANIYCEDCGTHRMFVTTRDELLGIHRQIDNQNVWKRVIKPDRNLYFCSDKCRITYLLKENS